MLVDGGRSRRLVLHVGCVAIRSVIRVSLMLHVPFWMGSMKTNSSLFFILFCPVSFHQYLTTEDLALAELRVGGDTSEEVRGTRRLSRGESPKYYRET